MLRLESVQRHATLFMTNYQEMSYVERLGVCNLLPLSYTREISDLVWFYNLIHGRINVSMDEYYLSDFNITRGRDQFLNTGIVRRIFKSYRCAHLIEP